jgi:DNA-binding MarR family transcriptional regulator
MVRLQGMVPRNALRYARGGDVKPGKATRSANLTQADEATARTLKLGDGLGFMVRLISTRANLLYQELTGQDEITPRQFGALLTLYQHGTLTLTELASHISVDRSTLTEMVRRMVREKLIVKSDNGEDRRSAIVSLTPEGEAALLRLVPGAAELQRALLAPIPPSERRQFLRWVKLVAGSGDTAT